MSKRPHTPTRHRASRLDPHDLQLHRRMIERLARAQNLARRASQLAEEANELSAAWRVWCRDLHERYGLTGPNDGVQEDGSITRGGPEHGGPCDAQTLLEQGDNNGHGEQEPTT